MAGCTAARQPGHELASALAAGRPASAGERRATLLAELQDRLVNLAVEKAALEKELEPDRGQLQQLQHKAVFSEQLQAALQQTSSSLQATEQMRQESGGLAEQQAQQNEQLQAQVEQAQAHAAAQGAQQARQAAAEALAKASLCRRILRHFREATAAAAAWRALKAQASQQGRRASQRRAVASWRGAAARQRQLRVLQTKRQRLQQRAVMTSWLQLVCMQRLFLAQTSMALSYWAARSCRRVLSHWCFYARQAKQLGVQLPSSPSSCSDAEQQDQQRVQLQGAVSGRSSTNRCRAPANYTGTHKCFASSVGAAELTRSCSSNSAAMEKQLQAAQWAKQLFVSVEFPCSQQQQQQHKSLSDQQLATSPAAAAADAAAAAVEAAASSLSPKTGSQQCSLRSLSARLSPVLARASVRQQQPAVSTAAGSGSSSDGAAGTLLAPAASSKARLSACDAAVAAASADVAEGRKIPSQPTKQSRRSMVLEAEAAALVAVPPRVSRQQQQSPWLSSWDTAAAANTPDSAATTVVPGSMKVSWQQHAVSVPMHPAAAAAAAAAGVEHAAALLRRASRQSAANTPRSAAWVDSSAACPPRRSVQQHPSPAERHFHRHASLSTGSLMDAWSRRPSLSLGAAQLSAAAAAAAAAGSAGGGGPVLPSVPLQVQLSFLGAARAQKLHRRWLLVKAWHRWQQLLQVRDQRELRLAAAAVHHKRCCKRKAWSAWQQHVHQVRMERGHPEGVDRPALLHLALQRCRMKQQVLLLRVIRAWWMQMQRAAAARRAAEGVAAGRQRWLLQQALQVLARNVQHSAHKQRQLQKAQQFCTTQQVRCCWSVWRQGVAEARVGAAQQAQQSQQLLLRVALRWQRLSAAAAAADARCWRLEQLQARQEHGLLSNCFAKWRCWTLQASTAAKAVKLQQAQQQLAVLKQQVQQEQQQVAGIAELQQQFAGLQQQLEAALASKSGLELVVQKQQQELEQNGSSHAQQLSALAREHQAAATVMQEQLDQAANGADEATQQLQQMQMQQAQQQLQQQLKQQSLEHQLQQQQQRQQQLEAREGELQQQLAASKAQAKELAGQLRRCSDKLNQQTQAVHALQRSLECAQDRLAFATSATRDQNTSITQQAVAAEKERLRTQQLLHNAQAAALKLQQQVQGLQRRLQEQQAAGEAVAAQHGLEAGRLAEQLALRDQAVEQLQGSLAALQDRLASQQTKVLAEVAHMRSGWSQAKCIIKQQRKTIKQQDLRLQLALNGALPGVALGNAPVLLQNQPEQLENGCAAGMAANNAAAEGDRLAAGVRSVAEIFPITSFVLQQQHLPQQQLQQHPGSGAGGVATLLPGSLAWAAVNPLSLGGNNDSGTAVQASKCSNREAAQGSGAFGLQQGQGTDQGLAGNAL
ncbi:hypothetical protein COO60DRAFT_541027 [Scenedesmus sp. NREL 46B-D3]|nr:hypothetical protein COO60DRAFT_541027 [Scenedesmus sp. NREL 46B-D3]